MKTKHIAIIAILVIATCGCIENIDGIEDTPVQKNPTVREMASQNYVTVCHDNERNVTCYTYGSGGIYCIPDSQLK
jgi:hypothetical protein